MTRREVPDLPRRHQGGRRRRRHAGLRHRSTPRARPTGLYRLDADTLTLDVDPLPAGGAGAGRRRRDPLGRRRATGQVYEGSATGGQAEGAGRRRSPAAPTALAPLADGRLAVLVGSEVAILARKDGKVLQTLELPEPGTCLAADPSGRWLAAGTAKGTVAVFDAEEKPEFLPGESARLHEGAVTALLFEPDELRFLSAGADLKLLSTHARGKLEPEDKGRGNNHTDVVTALIWGPGDRLYSGSRDGTIKSWPRVGAVKPATIKDGVGRVVALALVHGPRPPAAGRRLRRQHAPGLPARRGGQDRRAVAPGPRRLRPAPATSSAQDDPTRREAALKELAGLRRRPRRRADLRAGRRATPTTACAGWRPRCSATRRLPRAATLAGGVARPRRRGGPRVGLRGPAQAPGRGRPPAARPGPEGREGRRRQAGRPGAGRAWRRRDDQALARLLDALDAKTPEVRQAALARLETVHDPKSPEAEPGRARLEARRRPAAGPGPALPRGMLDDPAVQAALRRRAEDADPEVRRLGVPARAARPPEAAPGPPVARPGVAAAARRTGRAAPEARGRARRRRRRRKAKAAGRRAESALDDADFEPLLQATASRALDTCLRGARGLALLGDPRAFGLLLQLSREEDKAARAEVCRAMAALDDPRAVERLRSLLHDQEAEVRDAAFTALARLHQADPLLAAESGLNASAEDVRRRGLQALIAEVRKAPPRSPDDARLVAPRPRPERQLRGGPGRGVQGRAEPATGRRRRRARSGSSLRSVHADVRREVLTEAMAQVGEPWGWDLLLEFFNDPDPKLRGDAFAFAVKKTKGLEFLDAALGSRYADLRKKAVEALVKKHTRRRAGAARPGPRRRGPRRPAGGAGVAGRRRRPARAGARPWRARTPTSASGPPRPWRGTATRRRSAPLLALATAPEPTEAGAPARTGSTWPSRPSTGSASWATRPPCRTSSRCSTARTRRSASRRPGPWSGSRRDETLAALRQALQHADPEVKYHAALGPGLRGRRVGGLARLLRAEAGKVLSIGEQIAGGPGARRRRARTGSSSSSTTRRRRSATGRCSC